MDQFIASLNADYAKPKQIQDAPKGLISTKLKFTESLQRPGTMIAFVKEERHHIVGVREDYKGGKKICIVAPQIASQIKPGVLYDAVIQNIIREGHNYYKVIQAKPYRFKARMEMMYVPNAVYVVLVKFGNATIKFDPKDGIKPSMKDMKVVKELLAARTDLKDVERTVLEFEKLAKKLIKQYNDDGYIYAY